MSRPVRAPKIDPEIARAYHELESARLAKALERLNAERVQAIRFRFAGGKGMSKARLEQIYGKNLVYIALQQEDQK
jgi:hypothetical protein